MKSTFDRHLFKNEEILWEDSPRFLNFHDKEPEIFSLVVEVLGYLIFSQEVLLVIFIPIGIAVALFLILPLALQIILLAFLILYFANTYFRVTRSRYAISDKKVYIRIWNWWQEKEYLMQLDEIGDTRLEIYSNGSGVIHLLPKKPFKFKGKAIMTGYKRHYPTIEMVREVKAEQGILRKALKKFQG